MTKTPKHPPTDPATGAYVGSLAQSVALSGPQHTQIRKLLAEGSLTATQLHAKLGTDSPAFALNPHFGQSIRDYLTQLVRNGEAVMVTTTNRQGRHIFGGSYQLSEKGLGLLQKGL
jgi:hypothetical protein